MTTPHIVLFISGGNLQEVISDTEINVTVIDEDNLRCEENPTIIVNGYPVNEVTSPMVYIDDYAKEKKYEVEILL